MIIDGNMRGRRHSKSKIYLSWLLFNLKGGFDSFSHIFANICVEKAIKVEIDGCIADFQQVGNNAEFLEKK